MTPPKPHYHAYLLRIWQANETSENKSWHASLHDATTHQRIGFASLEALFMYLMNEVEQASTPHAYGPALDREDDPQSLS